MFVPDISNSIESPSLPVETLLSLFKLSLAALINSSAYKASIASTVDSRGAPILPDPKLLSNPDCNAFCCALAIETILRVLFHQLRIMRSLCL